MPVILPTPAELAAMPWHARLKARQQIDAFMATYGAPTRNRRNRIPRENIEFGERVRHLARQLERQASR